MMALSRFMHPRNKYKEGSDFKKLAELYPDFREHTTTDSAGQIIYNFKSEESLRILAITLLKHDFELDVEIPKEKLVPAIPLRLNYILWIEDLLKYAKLSETEEIRGIDIGTGAVCIYPLLCAKIYGWGMTGTEISETSVFFANKNVKKNSLDHLIKVIHVENDKSLLAEAFKDTVSYSFAMCNPPFFSDEAQKKKKRLPPRNAATGSASELLVKGGEREFVNRLIDDSLYLENRVKIYTTMLGQKSSRGYFRSMLRRRNIINRTWTEFCQGHTKRWGLAWTILPKEVIDLTKVPIIRTPDDPSKIKPPKDRLNETIFPMNDKFATLDELIALLKQWFQELKIEMKELDITDNEFDGWTCNLIAYEDSWSRARKRRRMMLQEEKSAKQPRMQNPESEKQPRMQTPESEMQPRMQNPESEMQPRMQNPESEMQPRMQNPESEKQSRMQNPESEMQPRMQNPESEMQPRMQNPEFEMQPRMQNPESEMQPRMQNPESEMQPRMQNPESEMQPRMQNPESEMQPRMQNPEFEKSYDCADYKKDFTVDSSSISKPVEPLFECTLTLEELVNGDDIDPGTDLVKMCMTLQSGRGGKDILETFRQYMINKLKIRDYLMKRSGTRYRGQGRRGKKRRGKKNRGSYRSIK